VGEEGQGDQGVGVVEAEGDPGDEPDLGVHGFGWGVGQAVVEGGVDLGAAAADPAAEVHERLDAAAAGPGQPPVQCLFPFVAFDFEDVPQAFLQQVGAVQAGVGAGDPLQSGVLAGGEVLGVLPQRGGRGPC
jgi:hypothetical protein